MKWYSIVYRSGLSLIIILVIVQYFGSNIADGLVAWGTILLAYVTYLLARTTVEQTDRIIKENRRQQQAEVLLQYHLSRLDKIEQWAKDGVKYSTFRNVTLLHEQYYGALPELYFLDSIGINILNLVNSDEPELSTLVKKATELLRDCLGSKGDYAQLYQSMREVINAVTDRRFLLRNGE